MSIKHSQVFYRKHKRTKPTIERGERVYLWDTDGNRYIDASGGPVVVNVGHGVSEIVEAIRAQAEQVAYAHAGMFTAQVVEELSAGLAVHLPMADARFFYLSSGSEAVETAIKLARQIQVARGETPRWKIIGRWGSYHGATLGALAVMGKPSMRNLYAPMIRDMPHVEPVFCYRCPVKLDYPACGLRCAEDLEATIKREGPETVAAFIGEPVAGATLGSVVPPDEYWPRIREICDRYGLLLIDDEVMTGMGRTGRWFGIEHWDVTPDIMCLGKGLTGGYLPLSATAARGEWVELLWERTGDFNHGGTFSHHVVAAAAGLAALRYIEQHDLVTQAASMGKLLGEKLHAAFDNHPHIGDIRGADRETKQPFPIGKHLSSHLHDHAFAGGLIVYPMSGTADGVSGDHVTIAPPFVVTEEQLDEIITRLQQAIDAAIG
jgi:adenosylmethionine-8-amino-7-oxononanoate aminotransferase